MSGPEDKTVLFTEYGTHKLIGGASVMGNLRVSDQRLIDALREAFEKAGYKVVDNA